MHLSNAWMCLHCVCLCVCVWCDQACCNEIKQAWHHAHPQQNNHFKTFSSHLTFLMGCWGFILNLNYSPEIRVLCYFCQRKGSEGELVFLGLVTDTIDYCSLIMKAFLRTREWERNGGINELEKNAATQREQHGEL